MGQRLRGSHVHMQYARRLRSQNCQAHILVLIPRHLSHLPADHCFSFIRIIEKVERKSMRFTKLYRPILNDTLARKILFVKTSMFSKCFTIAGECKIRAPTHPVVLGVIISGSDRESLRTIVDLMVRTI